MKNFIVSLMLGTAVFTTTPLFAMDEVKENNDQEKSIIHKCPACDPILLYPINEKEAGHNFFFALPVEVIQTYFLPALSLRDLTAVVVTSKTMHNVCHNPVIWDDLAIKEDAFIFPKVCPKECMMGLFGSKKRTYKVTLSQILSFIQQDTGLGNQPHLDSCRNTFNMKIGNRPFLSLRIGHAFNEHKLDAKAMQKLFTLLNPNAQVTFSCSGEDFRGNFGVCGKNLDVMDLNSEEYTKQLDEAERMDDKDLIRYELYILPKIDQTPKASED